MLARVLLAALLLFAGAAHATIFFRYDAESGTVGANLPDPPFCMYACGAGEGSVGTIQSTGGAPQGSKYFQWQTTASQGSAYNEIQMSAINNPTGNTYYLAYWFNFTRIGGNDIWYEGTSTQSGDKGIELRGDGIRWVGSRGQWDSYASNQDHRYTMWLGNPSFHLNPSLEHSDAYYQNQNGYSNTNPLQITYDAWHSAVMAIKVATNATGSVALWVDGTKILEYTNIQTASGTPVIRLIEMGGTIAQPAYDAPAHYRRFDDLLLTDTWQDVVDGGYLGGAAKLPGPGNPRWRPADWDVPDWVWVMYASRSWQ